MAAGKGGGDGWVKSPARAGAGTNDGIMAVAASNSADGATCWSNYGSCVDIWAPGASILSTKMGGGTTTKSGTSMAAPHVGGGAALYLSRNTVAGPTTVEGALRAAAVNPGTVLREYVGGF